MIPVTFGGRHGWLHPAGGDFARNVAVLLCPGLHTDMPRGQMPLRRLAERLSENGYTTLRFDYLGTGDSCDVPQEDGPEAVGHWQLWQRCVREAADWLREASGAASLVLSGVRLGATIAALATAQRSDIAGMMLIAPVLRGRSYVSQLTIEARLRGNAAAGSTGLDIHGLRLSARTLDLIAATDLRRIRLPPDRQVALFASETSSLAAECAGSWKRRGVPVTCGGLNGLERMMVDNTLAPPRPMDLEPLVDWICRFVPGQPLSEKPASPVLPATLFPTACVETHLRFGRDGRLCGTLCRPIGTQSGTAVVIGNAGRDPGYGPSRSGVDFARRLAVEGIASLRIDFAGLGDSPPHEGDADALTPLFDLDRNEDIGSALDVLEGFGYRRFMVQGLCAGAYHGLRAAIVDPRIDTLLLINLPFFRMEAGSTLGHIMHRSYSFGHYLRQLIRRTLWKRLAQGDVPLDVALSAQMSRLQGGIAATMLNLRRQLGIPGAQSIGHRVVTGLAARGARVLFLFSPADPGIKDFERSFGSDAMYLRGFANAAFRVLPEIDHNLSGSDMQRAAAEAMLAFIDTAPGQEAELRRRAANSGKILPRVTRRIRARRIGSRVPPPEAPSAAS